VEEVLAAQGVAVELPKASGRNMRATEGLFFALPCQMPFISSKTESPDETSSVPRDI
jgi:hypothetical protein